MRLRLFPPDHELGWTPLAWLVYLSLFIVYPLVPINPGAACFFIYGAAFVGRIGPPARAVAWLAGIVAELRLSEGTVRNYLSDAISKLGARNRVEAARLARGKGWL